MMACTRSRVTGSSSSGSAIRFVLVKRGSLMITFAIEIARIFSARRRCRCRCRDRSRGGPGHVKSSDIVLGLVHVDAETVPVLIERRRLREIPAPGPVKIPRSRERLRCRQPCVGADAFIQQRLADESVAVDAELIFAADRLPHAVEVFSDRGQVGGDISAWQAFDREIDRRTRRLTDLRRLLQSVLAVRLPLRRCQREFMAGVLVDGEYLDSGRAELLSLRLCQAPLRMNHAIVTADCGNASGAKRLNRVAAIAVGVDDRHVPSCCDRAVFLDRKMRCRKGYGCELNHNLRLYLRDRVT